MNRPAGLLRTLRLGTTLLGVVLAMSGLATAAAARHPVACAVPGPSLAAFSDAAIDRYLDDAEERTLTECTKRNIKLPKDFIAWVRGDPIVKKSVYGCRANPLPVLLGLRSLEIDLGKDTVRKDYTQLALAFAIQGSYAPLRGAAENWNDGDQKSADDWLPDVSDRPRLVLEIPGDPRVAVNTKDPARTLDAQDHIINFLEDHAPISVEVVERQLPPLEYDDKGVAKPRKATTERKTVSRGLVAADVIASAALQAEFNQYMRDQGVPDIRIACGDGAVTWFSTAAVDDKATREGIDAAYTLFLDAYRAKGRMPKERDAAPTASQSMAWFLRNDALPKTEAERAVRGEERFPLDAPWPVLLMLAADTQPLREREEIWAKFRDDAEMRTYGEYTGGIAQQATMQAARRLSPFPFSNGSIQMMWKDGGVCGTMGNIGARTHKTCGVPASTAGQPGHCALVRMKVDPKTGEFKCVGEQYATGGDEVTGVHAGWNYDDVGGRRPMVFHQSVAKGVNAGFSEYLDTLIMRRMIDAMPPAERSQCATALLEAAIAKNPHSIPAIEGAILAASTGEQALELLDAFDAATEELAAQKDAALYVATIRDLAHAKVRSLPPSKDQAAAKAQLETLERQGCTDAKLLAQLWRTIGGGRAFDEGTSAATVKYLADPARVAGKKASAAFDRMLKDWAASIKGKNAKAAKAAWATAMLKLFEGKEQVTRKGKSSLDPCVATLEKFGGTRAVPAPK